MTLVTTFKNYTCVLNRNFQLSVIKFVNNIFYNQKKDIKHHSLSGLLLASRVAHENITRDNVYIVHGSIMYAI
jgi:hypothetical protein